MQICRECGRQLADHAEFCSNCGRWTPLGETKKQKSLKKESGKQQSRVLSENDMKPKNIRHRVERREAELGAQGVVGAALEGKIRSGTVQNIAQTTSKMSGKVLHHGLEIKKQAVLTSILGALALIITMFWYVFFRVGTPEETIKKYEKALNEMDIEAVIECCDSATQKTYNSVLGVTDSLTGLDTSSLLGMSSALAKIEGQSINVEFEIGSIEYQDEEHCVVTVGDATGKSDEIQTYPMVLEGREWKLTVFPLDL